MQKKLPITSHQTHKLVTEKMRSDHWSKIMFALRILDSPSSAQKIAEKADLDYHAVARRMNELCAEGLVFVSGKGITDTNRPCQLYQLQNQHTLSQVHIQHDSSSQLSLAI